MKIAILGTRGIPNFYGGFEQFAENFALFLYEKGHDIYVYNSSSHPYKKKLFNGVHIIHQFDPEKHIGTAGQFIYDLNCILDTRKKKFDIILQLGYTSSSIWYPLHPKKSIVITNMDGLEWKRSKYSKLVQKGLKFAERFAVNNSNYLISDSLGIQNYLMQKYQVNSEYIAYGASTFYADNAAVLNDYNVEINNFNMIMARFEPENNFEIVLDGYVQSLTEMPILVIGNYNNKYGNYLKKKYSKINKIRFLGSIYNLNTLNYLRFYSNIYFHGHSVGGTNPSLLEAMASGALVAAHNNEFNRGVLELNAYYFSNMADVINIISTVKKRENLQIIENNYSTIESTFNWNKINEHYLQFFEQCLERNPYTK
ncbi:DUF1972 domain-containing protein [Flavobacterium branchiophilum]|uniref:Glycosyl transferase family 1 n=1 Tax=Flavobacterium branchiophilum TaxID=55197 RepID=A0A2H3KA91_9FLAO|nr:DUF1972 domain-containing protein [Flavobacterium branchiophilum]PDS23413.1 glycosyl transferase family 1 [Flavobacterium branchiophilum]